MTWLRWKVNGYATRRYVRTLVLQDYEWSTIFEKLLVQRCSGVLESFLLLNLEKFETAHRFAYIHDPMVSTTHVWIRHEQARQGNFWKSKFGHHYTLLSYFGDTPIEEEIPSVNVTQVSCFRVCLLAVWFINTNTSALEAMLIAILVRCLERLLEPSEPRPVMHPRWNITYSCPTQVTCVHHQS